jgi:hypothetical protein
MKKTATILFAVCLSAATSAQTIQQISTGAGYQKQAYINLSAGTQKQVTNTTWDIAFTVYGSQDAGVFINESSGSSMGSPLPLIEIYDALTDNFGDQPDPAFLTDFPLFNSEKSWANGAFNERRNPDDALDLGWGVLDPQTGEVTGNAVYVLKLRNGQYRKIRIESLAGGLYTFRYANLDGSNEVLKTIQKADHAGKTLAYFSLETGTTVNVEPTTGGFDLLYCRYVAQLLDPTTQEYIPYYVTGILSGPGAQVAEADGVDPLTVAYADYQDSLRTELDVIGHDWKFFDLSAWTVDADRVFFLKTAGDRVWKLHFVAFGGSTSGNADLEKTDLGIISAVQDPAALGLKAAVYPNPVQDQLTVSLDIPAALAQDGQLQVIDLQGRVVLHSAVLLKEGFQVVQLQAGNLVPGMYLLELQLPGQVISLGKILKG